ncbi:MAG: exo-alpha-sialidase [Saprospiraceae bacterium]|nr:exo-alpha-sialidase [Saprospiraceae bacterium]
MKKHHLVWALITGISLSFQFTGTLTAQDFALGDNLFALQMEHTHGSTIVALSNGDLLVAWFQGNGERWADDVRIMGARRKAGTKTWSAPFVMADVPEFPDINPVLFIDPADRLWLVWYTVIANQWETSLIKYRISEDYLEPEGAPNWNWQEVLHVKPGGPTERGIQANDSFVAAVKKQFIAIGKSLQEAGIDDQQAQQWEAFQKDILAKAAGENLMATGHVYKADGTFTREKLGYPYFRRMGWQTKNKPFIQDQRIILPLYSDGLEMTLFALTDDLGQHWSFSQPVVGIANIQAAVVEKKSGELVAYMRDNGPPPYRHPMSSSADGGKTWSPIQDSQLPNPGSGSDAVTLANGHWLMAYNDTEGGRHSLAISLSMDEGKTWPYTRHILLSNDPEQKATGAYPAIIQDQAGKVHLTYSYRPAQSKKESIRYFSFEEGWVKEQDQSTSGHK